MMTDNILDLTDTERQNYDSNLLQNDDLQDLGAALLLTDHNESGSSGVKQETLITDENLMPPPL